MDTFYPTIFGLSNEPERSTPDTTSGDSGSDDIMPDLEPVGMTSSHVGPVTDSGVAGGNGYGPSVTGDSRTGSNVDVEMAQASQQANEEADTSRANIRETRTSAASSASSPSRSNRRARVEADEDGDGDVDWDRRHPSHRSIDVPSGTTISLNEDADDIGNGVGSSVRVQPLQAQSSPGTTRPALPSFQFTPQPVAALGTPPGSGEAMRGIHQVFDDLNAARSATINANSRGSNNGEPGGTPGGDPGAVNSNAPSPIGGPTSFSAGLSVVFDSNGNAFTTRLRRLPTQMGSTFSPNVNPQQGTTSESGTRPSFPLPRLAAGARLPPTTPLQGTQDGAGPREGAFGDVPELSQHRMDNIGQALHALGQMITTGLGLGIAEKEDPERAKRLIAGLEEVPEGLVRRLERVGGAPGGWNGAGASEDQTSLEGCAICWDKLLDGETDENDWNDKGKATATEGDVVDSSGAENALANSTNNPLTQDQSVSPSDVTTSADNQEQSAEAAEKKPPKIVCLPCAHVFHASCLKPWFSRPRQTTCPTCRFNIDPENLTFRRTIPLPRRATATNANNANGNANPTVAHTNQTNGNTPVAGDGTSTSQPVQPPAGFAQFSAQPAGPPAVPAGTNAHPGPHGRSGEPTFVLGIDLIFGLPPGVDPTSGSGTPTAEAGRPMEVDATTAGSIETQPAADQAGQGIPQANPLSQDEMIRMEQEFAVMAEAQARNALRSLLLPLERQPSTPSPPLPASSLASSASPQEVNRNVGTSSIPNPPSNSTQLPPVNLGNPPPPLNLPPGWTTGGPGVAGQLPNFAQMFGGFLNSAAAQGRASNVVPPTAGPQPESGTTAPTVDGTPLNASQPNDPQDPVGGVDVVFGFHTVPFAAHPNSGRGPNPQRPPRIKKEWTLPPAPGLTLRQRVEQKERDLGVRCHDISCGIGPSDEDPEAESDITKRAKHLAIRSFGNPKEAEERVCTHMFHGPCLVSAQRVALRGGQESLKDGEVEVTCPVCRTSGCLLKEEWDEGVEAL